MTELERDFESATNTPATLQVLQQQVSNLQALFIAALMALVLLSVGVNIYLYYQMRIVRKELVSVRRIVQDYETSNKQLVNKFVSSLIVYAQSHTNFNPILQKFGLPLAPPPQPSPSNQAPTLPPKE